LGCFGEPLKKFRMAVSVSKTSLMKPTSEVRPPTTLRLSSIQPGPTGAGCDGMGVAVAEGEGGGNDIGRRDGNDSGRRDGAAIGDGNGDGSGDIRDPGLVAYPKMTSPMAISAMGPRKRQTVRTICSPLFMRSFRPLRVPLDLDF
jgi:hypothetical protein